MRRWVGPVLVTALLLAGAAYVGVRALTEAIDRSKSRRSLADANSIAAAIEAYRVDHGAYPVSFGAEGLERALEPWYVRTMPDRGVSYFSDGRSYALFVRASGDSGPARHAAIEIVNGKVVAWPRPLFGENLSEGSAGVEPP